LLFCKKKNAYSEFRENPTKNLVPDTRRLKNKRTNGWTYPKCKAFFFNEAIDFPFCFVEKPKKLTYMLRGL
jgi:hypothetical protein